MNTNGVRMFIELSQMVRSIKSSMEYHDINFYEEQIWPSPFIDDYGYVVSYLKYLIVLRFTNIFFNLACLILV